MKNFNWAKYLANQGKDFIKKFKRLYKQKGKDSMFRILTWAIRLFKFIKTIYDVVSCIRTIYNIVSYIETML